MSEYLLINIGIILFPLLFSFEKNVKFITNIRFYFFSVLVVSTIFIIWDVIFTKLNVWAFSENHTHNFRIFHLPLEEILFFITVPYSTLFLLEVIKYYVKFYEFKYGNWLIYIFIIFTLIFFIFNYNQLYSAVVSLYLILVLVLLLIEKKLIYSNHFWILTFFMFIPFFLVNYILTSVPIVTYNPNEFSNFRVTTIPFEDFLYSLSLITSYTLVYNITKKK